MLPPRQDWVNKIMKKRKSYCEKNNLWYQNQCSIIPGALKSHPPTFQPQQLQTRIHRNQWSWPGIQTLNPWVSHCGALYHPLSWFGSGQSLIEIRFVHVYNTRRCQKLWHMSVQYETEELYIICLGSPYRFKVFGTLSLCRVSCMWWNHYHPLSSKLMFAYFEYISLQKITHIT